MDTLLCVYLFLCVKLQTVRYTLPWRLSCYFWLVVVVGNDSPCGGWLSALAMASCFWCAHEAVLCKLACCAVLKLWQSSCIFWPICARPRRGSTSAVASHFRASSFIASCHTGYLVLAGLSLLTSGALYGTERGSTESMPDWFFSLLKHWKRGFYQSHALGVQDFTFPCITSWICEYGVAKSLMWCSAKRDFWFLSQRPTVSREGMCLRFMGMCCLPGSNDNTRF